MTKHSFKSFLRGLQISGFPENHKFDLPGALSRYSTTHPFLHLKIPLYGILGYI